MCPVPFYISDPALPNNQKDDFTVAKSIDSFLKRLIDIVVSIVGLVFLAPLFGLIAYFLKRDSPGPVYFRCVRMGRHEQPFLMLKFRTMFDDPKSFQGPRVTAKGDDRITPFGHWLRDTKINELPQLWNVLMGDMSLVGPRPEDVSIAQGWPDDLRHEILSVRPGVTSPASILYHDEEKLLSKVNVMEDYLKNILPDKMRLDRLYVHNRSITSDIDIIFWTMAAILPTMTKAAIPEGYIFSGPISRLVNRYVSWFLIDILTSIITVGLVGLIWRSQTPLNWGLENFAILALALAFLFSSINSILGINRIVWRSANFNDGVTLSLSSWLGTLLLLAINYILPLTNWFSIPPLPVAMIINIGIFAQIGFLISRFRWRMLTALASSWLAWRRNTLDIGERVLMVGAGESFFSANWLLRHSEYHYIFNIIGVVDDEIPTMHGMRLDGCLVLGKLSDIPAIVEKQQVGFIIFTTSNIPANIKEYAFGLMTHSDVRLIFLDNLTNMISQQLTVPVRASGNSIWSEDYLKFLAMHDHVTGLPNRFLFEDRLIHSIAFAKRYKNNPIVMFINLENKRKNEVILQKQKEEIQKVVAERLLKLKRESDTLGMLGEREFGFILESVPDDNAVKSIANRVISTLSQPINIANNSYVLRTTISVCPVIEEERKKAEEEKRHHEVLEFMAAHRKVVAESNDQH